MSTNIKYTLRTRFSFFSPRRFAATTAFTVHFPIFQSFFMSRLDVSKLSDDQYTIDSYQAIVKDKNLLNDNSFISNSKYETNLLSREKNTYLHSVETIETLYNDLNNVDSSNNLSILDKRLALIRYAIYALRFIIRKRSSFILIT